MCTCAASCEDYSARVLIGSDVDYYASGAPLEDSYYIGNDLATGRLELCIDGTWRKICQDTWTRQDASVVCYQLGFSRAGRRSRMWMDVLVISFIFHQEQ